MSAQLTFLQFVVVFGVNAKKPQVDDVGAFVELLVRSKKATGTIRNYISAIKQFYIEYGSNDTLSVFQSAAWKTMLRGLTYTSRPCVDARTAMTREDLERMIMCCGRGKEFLPLKVALIFGYFGYLRISNLVPETRSTFDPDRSTTWADVIPRKEGIILMLKWTKSLQSQVGATPVPLSVLPGSILCPVGAWEQYVSALPVVKAPGTTPFLLSTEEPVGSMITVSRLRAMFNQVVVFAGLSRRGYTPHSLRRGGGDGKFLPGRNPFTTSKFMGPGPQMQWRGI